MNDAIPRPQAKTRKALTPLLEIRNLTKSYDGQHAVDDVSLTIYKGEIFALLGASGCGKSTLGRGICKLEKPTGGTVILDGEDISGYNDSQMRPVRKKVQMVFQDPYASLNPRMSVFDIIAEPFIIHKLTGDKAELEKKGIPLYYHYRIAGYPTDTDHILSEDGFGRNDYIETSRPLVVVTAPGPGSGKMATCL